MNSILHLPPLQTDDDLITSLRAENAELKAQIEAYKKAQEQMLYIVDVDGIVKRTYETLLELNIEIETLKDAMNE